MTANVKEQGVGEGLMKLTVRNFGPPVSACLTGCRALRKWGNKKQVPCEGKE